MLHGHDRLLHDLRVAIEHSRGAETRLQDDLWLRLHLVLLQRLLEVLRLRSGDRAPSEVTEPRGSVAPLRLLWPPLTADGGGNDGKEAAVDTDWHALAKGAGTSLGAYS